MAAMRWWDGDRWTGHTSTALDHGPSAHAPPGWHADPWGAAAMRWWDGDEWTGHTSALVTPAKPWFPQQNERDEHQSIRGGVTALVGFVLAFALSFGVAFWLVAFDEPGGPLVTITASALALWTGLLTACVTAVRFRGSGSLHDLGLARLSLRDLGIGALSALIARVGAFVVAIPILLLFRDDFDGGGTSFGQSLEPGLDTAVVLVAIAVIGAPFFEELFFRGLVQSVLTRRWGVRTAICVQAVLFGLVHLINFDLSLGQYVLTFVSITFTGLVLGALRWRTGRLGPGMVAHALFNLVAVVVILAVN